MKHLRYDTVAAIATPIGEGALSIIRLSGADSLLIADKVFKGTRSLSDAAGFTAHYGHIVSQSGMLIDEVLATVFREPQSFTGENSVEFSCHGGLYVTHAVLDTLLDAGARQAEPGEFTRRAFLNGRIDLSQAEAVADLIAARTARAHSVSLEQLEGSVASRVESVRAVLVDLCALLEIDLDFGEEGIEVVTRGEIQQKLVEARARIDEMASTFKSGRVFREGVTVVFVGRPNAGKSSLFNALLKEDRAIVTSVPGTTRDSLEESVEFNGVLFRLVDTAGLRESTDVVENEGILRTRNKLQAADIVVMVVDSSVSQDLSSALADGPDIRPGQKLVVAFNKSDLAGLSSHEASPFHEGGLRGWTLFVSALAGTGIDLLKSTLLTSSLSDARIMESSFHITNKRHFDAMVRASMSLEVALEAAMKGSSNEFLAFDVREATDALGQVTGEITTDEMLDAIFSKFCIGK